MASDPTPTHDAAPVIAAVPAPVALFDIELNYVAASPAWIDAFGLAGAALTGQRHDQFCAYARAALAQAQRRALDGETVEDCPIGDDGLRSTESHNTLAAHPLSDASGAVIGVIVALHRTAKPPSERTYGLIERERFVRELEKIVGNPDPARRNALILAINLDNLRAIGNLHGVASVENVVAIVGERLASVTRTRTDVAQSVPSRGYDMITVLNNGQFGVLCTVPPTEPAAAQRLAERLLQVVRDPIAVDGRELRLDASVGLVLTGQAQATADEALSDLDIALQRAQSLGPGKAVAWEPSLTRAAARRYTLADELRRGFDNGEFALHYQPVLRLRDNRMVGAEALLRWNHPSEGIVPSVAFLPVLEETGLIVELGTWAVREAVRQLESWHLLYGRNVVEWLSVNLSARQLAEPASLLAALRAMHDASLPVPRLMLEAGEQALTREPEAAPALIKAVREFGVRFVIDDFRADRGSLSILGSYPLETVKIDPWLVGQIGTWNGDKLLETLLVLARMNGASIIAKGVETAVQRDFLKNADCDCAQGHLFATPMDGALLGAYALVHSVSAERPRSVRAGGDPLPTVPPAAVDPPTSAGQPLAR